MYACFQMCADGAVTDKVTSILVTINLAFFYLEYI